MRKCSSRSRSARRRVSRPNRSPKSFLLPLRVTGYCRLRLVCLDPVRLIGDLSVIESNQPSDPCRLGPRIDLRTEPRLLPRQMRLEGFVDPAEHLGDAVRLPIGWKTSHLLGQPMDAIQRGHLLLVVVLDDRRIPCRPRILVIVICRSPCDGLARSMAGTSPTNQCRTAPPDRASQPPSRTWVTFGPWPRHRPRTR